MKFYIIAFQTDFTLTYTYDIIKMTLKKVTEEPVQKQKQKQS